MDRRTRTPHVPTTTQHISPPRTLLDRPHTACSAGTGSRQSGSPRSSLTGSGCDSTTTVQAFLAPQVFGRWKDASSSTPLNQPLVKSEEDWWRVPNADEECESYSGVRSYNRNSEATRSVATEKQTSEVSLRILREASVDLLDSNEEECSSRVVVFRIKDGVVRQRQKRSKEFSNSNRPTCSKAAKIAVDPTPLSATSAFLTIQSADITPVDLQTSFCHDDTELQDTKVASADNGEERHLPSKIDVGLLMRWNRYNPSNVLRGLPRWRLGEVGNRITKFQATARGYLLRTNPWIRELKEPVSSSPSIEPAPRALEPMRRRPQRRPLECAPEADNDRMLQLERQMDQEIKSREAMEGRFEEVNEVRLLREQVYVMQEEIDLYKEKLEAAETESTKQIEQLKHLDEQVQKESGLRKSLETQLEEARAEILSLKDVLEQQSLDLQCEFGERFDETERFAEVTKQILEDQVKVLEQKAEKEAKARLELERRLEKVQAEMRALVVVPHHPSGDRPARPSKDNSTKPPSIKPAHDDPPIKTSVGPPRSRTPRAVVPNRLAAKTNARKVAHDQTEATIAGVPSNVLFSRASLMEDKRAVLGPAKATTNIRSGKSTAVQKEYKPSLPY